MIESNDGGANISNDGGRTWSTIMNQPTAQFYRVALDNDFPYNVYGAQQDNTTVRIASRTGGGGITEQNWYDVGGGESGWIAPDPTDSRNRLRRLVRWPDHPPGPPHRPDAQRQRLARQHHGLRRGSHEVPLPVELSPSRSRRTIRRRSTSARSVLLKTTNEGQSWESISPDLTRNDKSKMGTSGGPITQDNTSDRVLLHHLHLHGIAGRPRA